MSKSYPLPVPPPARSGNPTVQAEMLSVRRGYLDALTPLQAADLRADENDAERSRQQARADALENELRAAEKKIDLQDEELTELREAQEQQDSEASTDLQTLKRAIAKARTPQSIARAAAQIAGAIATEAIAPPAGRSLLYALQIALSAARTAHVGTAAPGCPSGAKLRSSHQQQTSSRAKPRRGMGG